MCTTINIINLGDLKEKGKIYNAIGKANQQQSSFHFEIVQKKIKGSEKSIESFILSNGGYDFCSLAEYIVKKNEFINHTIFITSEPFSTKDQGNKPEEFYFHHNNSPYKYSIISTYLWEQLEPEYSLQSYIILMFALIMIQQYIELGIHDETRGCICDYCDNPSNILNIFEENAGLCTECNAYIYNQLEKGKISIDILSSIKRLINRGLNKKICFVAFPYTTEFRQTYKTIQNVLEKWSVFKAEDEEYPQKISDAIQLDISECDLFIAEITNPNPNVFYEIGLAQNTLSRKILLSQNEDIPFDLKLDRVIKYKSLEDLKVKLSSLNSLN